MANPTRTDGREASVRHRMMTQAPIGCQIVLELVDEELLRAAHRRPFSSSADHPLFSGLGLRRTAKQMAAIRALHVDPRRRPSVGEGLRARGPAHRARRTAWYLIRVGFRFRSLAHALLDGTRW
jgi:hypothetical protein